MIARTLWFALTGTSVVVCGLNQTAVIASGQSTTDPNQSHGASVFELQCSASHGADGKGKAQMRTPDFTSPAVQSGLYAFGVQKKIWRHAFSFGFTNGPATTVSDRPATRAAFLNDPSADKPSALFIGFDIMRQLQRLRPREWRIK
jgi:cytochrome c